jgi:hypothetical protein
MNISKREMMHSVHILFGDKYAQMCKDLKRYVIKYGDDNANHYFTSMLCREDGDKLSFRSATIAKENRSVFSPGIESMFAADFIEKPITMPDDKEYIRQFLSTVFSQRVVNVSPEESNRLSICMYVPLDDENIWNRAKSIIAASADMMENIDIDLFVISPDLLHLFEQKADENAAEEQVVLHMSDEQHELSKKLITDIVKFKSQNRDRLKHVLLMQNYNSKGYSLNLDYEGFLRIVGEYALTALVAYNDIFNINTQDADKPLSVLGLSVLSLDRFDYVQYMLHRAYLYVMEREKVMVDEVQVNKLSLLVQDKLKDKVRIFSNIYDEHVVQMLNDGVPHNAIAAKIDEIVLSKIEQLTEELQDYIYKDQLSLPEKRATLAQLLGEDDPLLSGQQFNKEQLEMDDCSEEVMEFLISANNCLLSQTSYDVPATEFPEHLQLADYAAFSDKTGSPVAFGLKELKRLRVDIRRDSEYIRKRQAELDRLERNLEDIKEERKVLKDGGFEYGGTIFKVVEEIEQRPFEQTYTPLGTLGVTSADLRSSFTNIKSQGQVGACAAFAFTSVYEYILNKNGKLTESDLSERFLYYNTRKRMGDISKDSGSNMYDAGKALEEDGLCSEELCPYVNDFEAQIETPSAQAYADGLTRRVAETMNVNIKEQDIKSAIAEGYPVIVSLHLHESFNNIGSDGFVRKPDESDPVVGWHAMVIVGFSDKDKVFIVRNSWGTDFGDKGYCYIPYSYVLDSSLNSMCCIITKISASDIEVKGNSKKLSVQFDETNTRILAALLRIKIDDTKQGLAQKKSVYDRLFLDYADRIETAKVASNRNLLEEGTQKRLEWEKSELVTKEQNLRVERLNSLEGYQKMTVIGHICFASFYVLAAAVFALLYYFRYDLGLAFNWPDPVKAIFFSKASYWTYGVLSLIGVLWLFVWTPYRKIHKKRLEQEYDGLIEEVALAIQQRNSNLDQLRLRFHLAGAIIERLTTLKQNLLNKFHSMNSFSENVFAWYHEEKEKVTDITTTREPFISILNSEKLNSYFLSHAEKVTQNLRLYNLFKDKYDVSDEAIVEFKYKLKDSVVKMLFDTLADFTVYRYVSVERDYEYLDKNRQGISELLKVMDFKSEPFVRMGPIVAKRGYNGTFVKMLFLNADIQASRDTWDRLLSSNFQDEPLLGVLDSPYKMTLIQLRGVSPEDLLDFD